MERLLYIIWKEGMCERVFCKSTVSTLRALDLERFLREGLGEGGLGRSVFLLDVTVFD